MSVVDVTPMVFDVGDLVVGWGGIVEDADGVWFDPPHAIALGFPFIRPRSPHAVPLLHHDPGAVATEFGADGSIPGCATVTGVWLTAGIDVTHMDPRPQFDRFHWQPRTEPPCKAPPGGWPAGSYEDVSPPGSWREDVDGIVSSVLFRPRPGSAVRVITTIDPAAVERRFRPLLGPRLCVVRSRWSSQQLDQVRDHLSSRWDTWALTGLRRHVEADAQSIVEVELLRVLPEMATWAGTLPREILRVCPTLTPARDPAPALDRGRALSQR